MTTGHGSYLNLFYNRCQILQVKSSQLYRGFTSRSQNRPHRFQPTTILPTSNRERFERENKLKNTWSCKLRHRSSTLAQTSISTQWERDQTLWSGTTTLRDSMAEGGRQTNKKVSQRNKKSVLMTKKQQVPKSLAQDKREVRPAGVQGVQGDHAWLLPRRGGEDLLWRRLLLLDESVLPWEILFILLILHLQAWTLL